MKKIAISVLLLLLVGCGSPLLNPNVSDPYTKGCVAVVSSAQIGALQVGTGGVESCKVKCTNELPEDYTFEYADPRTGCNASIGKQ